MNYALSCFRVVCATALVTIAPAALAQSLPAGVQGYWKITKQRPEHPIAMPGGCMSNPSFSGPTAKNTRGCC